MNYFWIVALVCALRSVAEDSSAPANGGLTKIRREADRASSAGSAALFDELTAKLSALEAKDEALTAEVKRLTGKVKVLNIKTRIRRIPNQGRPKSSSDWSTLSYTSKQAFGNYQSYWCNKAGRFPAMIYSELEKPYRLAKIGASFVYCPGKFEIIGSNDGTTWTTMKTVENPGITKRHQFKSWSVPAFNRTGFHPPFKYIGLRWPKAATENSYPAGTTYAGVGTISMWEEI